MFLFTVLIYLYSSLGFSRILLSGTLNNPDVFENCLREAIQEKTGLGHVNLKDFFTNAVVKKLHRLDTAIYANTSLVSTKISIPVLTTNSEFKGHMFMYLTHAHDKTKKKLAEMRKKANGK